MMQPNKVNPSHHQQQAGMNKSETFDEMSKVRKQFDYVKKMIRIWIKDVEYYQNE